MNRIVCALLTLTLSALGSAAIAKQVTLGAVSLNLPPPSGYCEMDEAQPSDARMISAVNGMLERTSNRLLAVSVDCRQLDDWRSGRRQLIDNMAQYQTLRAWENASLPATPAQVISSVCAELRAQGDKIASTLAPEIRTRAEEVMKNVRVDEMKFIGVMGEDANACYASLLQRFRAETGADVTQATVFATTVIKDKLIYYYLFAPFVSGQTVNDLLAQLRVNVASLEAANRN